MTFFLRDLAQVTEGRLSPPNTGGVGVTGLALSSNRVQKGDLFVAVRGSAQDGHKWVPDAFSRGAEAVVVESEEAAQGRPALVVKSSRQALSRLAAHFAGYPGRKLKVVGITGTNGKTTTNWLVQWALNRVGMPCARVGTLGMEFQGESADSLTTPDPVALQGFLARSSAAGALAAVLEVSSHGLDQGRVDDLEFDAAVFTNITRDHLDYHETFENYLAAKLKLFSLVRRTGLPAVVVNLDSTHGAQVREIAIRSGVRDLSFGSCNGAPLRIVEFRESSIASELELALDGQSYNVKSPLIGRHNAENLAAAFGACVGIGVSPERVTNAFEDLRQVPGRLERVGPGRPRVIVDYAHTPDALERAITAVRPSTRGRLYVVFGCGGDRDKGKRPQMAAIAERLADRVIVTSDNPRTEDPDAIISDIVAEGAKPFAVIADRREAIRSAVRTADADDTILIAGKGHEDYQIVGTQKIRFSDQEEAAEALSSIGR